MINNPTKKPAQFNAISVIDWRGTIALNPVPAFIPAAARWIESESLQGSLMDGMTPLGSVSSYANVNKPH
jgi:hypothetical protein